MPVIDDKTGILSYSGNWVQESGSTRQWEGGIHSTELNGSSVRLTFRGYRVRVMATLLASNPNRQNIVADVTFDGALQRISKVAQSSDVYADTWWDSGTVTAREHTIIVTYRGDGSHPFQFDSFDIEGEAIANNSPMPIAPVAAPLPNTTTQRPAQTQQPTVSQSQAQNPAQSQTRVTSVVTQTQVSTVMSNGVAIRTVTTESTGTTVVPAGAANETGLPGSTGHAASGSGNLAVGQTTVTAFLPSGPESTGGPQTLGASSESKEAPIGLIIGCLLGGLVVIALAFILFWLRRRRRRAAQRHVMLMDESAQGRSLGGIQVHQVSTNDRIHEYGSDSAELSVARSSMYTNAAPQPYDYCPGDSETNSDVPPPAYQPSEYDARQSMSMSAVYQPASTTTAFSSKSRLALGYD